MAHTHDIYDDDTYFSIDPDDKTISNDTNTKPTLIKGAHKSEAYTFELPRVIEGHDMSLCNRVEIHYINIGAKEQASDVYLVKDLGPHPEDDEYLTFTWLITKAATGLSGSLNFAIVFKCLDGDVLDYCWPTDIYSGIKVLDTIDNGEAIVRDDYKDILETWMRSFLDEIISETKNYVDEAVSASETETKNYVDGIINTSKNEMVKYVEDTVGYTESYIRYNTGLVDVGTLPTQNICESFIYRVPRVAIYMRDIDGNIVTNKIQYGSRDLDHPTPYDYAYLPLVVRYVETLPEIPELDFDGNIFASPGDPDNTATRMLVYYVAGSNDVMAHNGNGWYGFNGMDNGDVPPKYYKVQLVKSIDEVTDDKYTMFVQVNDSEGVFYRRDAEWHELVDKAELEGALKSIDSIGFNNKAGGKGYKVTGIVLADDTIITQTSSSNSSSAVVGYELRTTEGLQVGFTYSVRLGSAAYNVGEITSISGNRILVSNAPQIKSFNTNADNLKSGFVANVLTIKGHPELGDVEVGFNAFATGSGNYVAERNGFSSGSGNHVLGCNGATFGQGNIAGYDALVWGKGNRALVDQSAVGGKYADQSSNALFTLGNGYVDDTGEHRRNAFEVRLDGTTTVGLPKDATDAINVQMLRFYLGLDAIDTWTGFTVSLHANGTASISDGADASSEVIIPGAYRGYLVQDIAKGCFQNNLEISDVNIQEGVQTIYANAFQNCKSLSKVQLPNTLVKIDYGAFQNTALSSINLPESLKSIHLNAFRNAPLTCTISIPKSCRYIGYNHDGSGPDTGYVFNSNSIPAIVFEGIPIKISPNAFKGCICNIHVPWSEGEVEGAPWGTSGTVYYNSNGYADIKKYVDEHVAKLNARINTLILTMPIQQQ